MVSKQSGHDRIADLLAAYGSDVSRWPADGRAAIAALSPSERAARLREDEALDQLLASAAQAASDAPPSDALMTRILAAAPARAAHASAEPSGGKVVELATVVTDGKTRSHLTAHRNRDWAAVAALLAASLVLGLFVGSTDRGRDAAQRVGELAGINISAASVQMTALDEALQNQDDEDIL